MATPEEFARQFGPLAIQKGSELGVNPEILLGQWGLETGWGKSVVPGTNNLGNIKDFSGGGVRAVDNMTGSNDAYRSYASPQAFGDDFTDLISRRYGGAKGAGGDAARYATALKQGGYAEDPDYVRKLTGAAATARRAMGIRSDSEPNSGMVAMYQQGNMRPASMALDDEWASLGKQFSQPAGKADAPKDEWDALRQQFSQAPAQRDEAPVAPPAAKPEPAPTEAAAPQRSTGQELARQVGLSLRAPVQAGAEFLGMLGDPLNATANLFGAKLPPLSQTLTRGIDAVFPTPETDREKFVNKVAAGGYSAALPIGAASAAKPASDLGRRVTAEMARGPVSQILGGSAAAGASELAAQDGSGLPGQIAAGVIGGMVGGKAGNVASRVGNAAGQAAGRVAGSLPGAKAAASAQADAQIAAALQQQGITFSELDSNVKNALRNATAGAAKAGQTADPAALARLARFQSLGIEPTAAMVTRDPYAWANEKRLSKLDEIGRPLVDRYRAIDQTLGNEIAGLSGRAPEALPAADAAGDAVGAAVRNAWKSSGEGVDKMYDAYRAANPYANVPGQQVADAYGNIAREYGKSQIPSDVMERLNAFGFTNPDRAARTAFTVQEADTLKRLIGNNLNPANRTQAKALGILGNSIDDAMRSGADSASTGALLTEARAAAKQRFDAFKPRPLDALVNGNVGPERWLDTHVLSKSTSAADMARTMKQLDSLGDGVSDQVRGAAAKWLMDKAYSNDPSRKAISGVALDTAIKQVGERKLAAIFSQEGLTKLKDIAAAAKDARFDVVDSAVNRSNTGSDIANMMLKVTRIPGFSTLNTGSLGLAGGLLNMGAKSLNDSANAKAVAQAMRGGIAATPQMQAALGLRPQAPNSLLRPLLPTSLALPGSLDSRERNQR